MVYRESEATQTATCPTCSSPLTTRGVEWLECDKGHGVWLGRDFASFVVPIARSNYQPGFYRNKHAMVPACAHCQTTMREVGLTDVRWWTCTEHGHWLSTSAVQQFAEQHSIDLSAKSLRAYHATWRPLTSGTEITIAELWVRIQKLEQQLLQEVAARRATEARNQ
jgi:Zn-finger nucleic acid-binding protein